MSPCRSPILRRAHPGRRCAVPDLIRDPALTAVLDKPGGQLAGKSTLNRLEHAGKIGLDRHHKLDHDPAAIARLPVEIFLDAHREPPVRIVLDLDATGPGLDPGSALRRAGRAALPRLLRLLLLPAALCLSVVATCSRPSCARRASMPPTAASPRSRASSARSASAGRRRPS